MSNVEVSYSKGLADVIADESKICTIDGHKGELYYRGYGIQPLAERSNFYEVTYLLVYGKLPTSTQLEQLKSDLLANRPLPDYVKEGLSKLPRETHPMRMLQAGIAMLGMSDPTTFAEGQKANQKSAIRLTAQFATMIAFIARHREGKDYIPPRVDLDHAANFLYMLTGKVPETKIARIFDTCLVLHAEHTFNASTFTGRVVASTLADMYTSVSAASGALFGPLHGGANEQVLHMVEEIGTLANTDKWFEDATKTKKKVMGMGHRVYKTIDPRAKILKKILTDLAKEKGDTNKLDILNRVAELMAIQVAATGKKIWPNVDFYSGVLYQMMEIDPIYFTPIFALSRITGWCAHILELWEDNKLYRPECHYTGDIELQYIPIQERK